MKTARSACVHEAASLTLFQGLQLQVSVIPNDKTTTVTEHLGCLQLFHAECSLHLSLESHTAI